MMAHTLSVLLAVQLVVFSTHKGFAGDQTQPQIAKALFRLALSAAETGRETERDQLLRRALQVDPEFQLARWYLGQVKYDGQWKTVDAISQEVSSDPNWQEYQDRVTEIGEDVESHAEVARWCRKYGLPYLEKWHWWQVLNLDPDHPEALTRTGLRWFEGMLLTKEQIKQYQATQEQANTDYNRYTNQFDTWIRQAAVGDATEQAYVVRKFGQVRDLAAMPALVDSVFFDAKNEKLIREKLDESADSLLEKLRLAVVADLGELSEHDATLTLLDLAVNWPELPIATAAAKCLQYRNKMHYMPLLMGQLAEPLELDVSVNVLGNGKIKVHQDLTETGPLRERKLHRQSTFYTRTILLSERGTLSTIAPGSTDPNVTIVRQNGRQIGNLSRHLQIVKNPALDFQRASAQVALLQDQVDEENERRNTKNSRVNYVLAIATGEDHGEDPSAWWDSWKQYNELYTPDQLPVEQQYQAYDYTADSIRTYSCFAAGTPVWTEAGPVPIEEIQNGDIVLSQDPSTGELDYRPVLQTTVRPPSATVKLGIGAEEILSTRGHRFWVAGKGWNMAKFLQPGAQLWSLTGEVNLDMAEPTGEYEAYNLEVGQFHTFFVGQSKLLVHDNTCPLPVFRSLPGVEAAP